MSLRIGYDAKRVFHNFRGLGNYARNLLQGLYQSYPENNYILYTPPFSDTRALDWKNKYSNFDVRTPKFPFDGVLSSVWRSFFLSSMSEKDNLDIFHGLSNELPQGIEKTRIKKVVTIHDLLFLRYPHFFPWIDRVIYLNKIKSCCQKADVIIAICKQTKNDIIEMIGVSEDKIKVIYQSCHPKFYSTLETSIISLVLSKFSIDTPYILYVGALVERKNISSLIQSFALIYKNHPHKLVLAGEGGYRNNLQREIQDYNLEDRVIITGYVDRNDLPALYQGAELFVFPSFFEGFGIPIIEALFSRVPVITNRGSCFPETGGPTTCYVNCSSPEELSEAMNKYLADPNLREETINQGRDYAEKFHWRNTSKEIHDFYLSL